MIVDVLRASSSIVTALANGCAGIYPIAELSDAFLFANGVDILACGERNGVRIPGYHLGNSPAEFTKQAVAGKRLVMCTTNGTRAIRAGAGFRRAFVGCFLNAPAVSSLVEKESADVTVICAGREGQFSLEDTLSAGMILSELDGQRSDTAVASAALFKACRERLEQSLLESQHGSFLRQIGFAEDVRYCAATGISNVIPEVFPSGEAVPYDLVIKPVNRKALAEGSER